jgi:hypothetical protein
MFFWLIKRLSLKVNSAFLVIFPIALLKFVRSFTYYPIHHPSLVADRWAVFDGRPSVDAREGYIRPVASFRPLCRHRRIQPMNLKDLTESEKILSGKLQEQNQWEGDAADQHSLAFSLAMISCGASLGPFLDHFHSIFKVLSYDTPIQLTLWSQNPDQPALITAWWVPGLFGLAGFIIGWLTIFLEYSLSTYSANSSLSNHQQKIVNTPSVPLIIMGVSLFIFQYWLSGFLYASEYDRSTILYIMTSICTAGFLLLNRSVVNFITGLATAIGGPLIEVFLITYLPTAGGNNGYHYSDLGETGFFPLWIVPSRCRLNLTNCHFSLHPF